MPWPPQDKFPPHPPPLGHVNKTPSPHRTKKCLWPTPPRIISGTALNNDRFNTVTFWPLIIIVENGCWCENVNCEYCRPARYWECYHCLTPVFSGPVLNNTVADPGLIMLLKSNDNLAEHTQVTPFCCLDALVSHWNNVDSVVSFPGDDLPVTEWLGRPEWQWQLCGGLLPGTRH